MPVFHGLFPEPHDTAIQQLLCSLAHWHAFAKLRVHTDTTLEVLEMATQALGDFLRTFVSETCPHFKTRELPRESEARNRRQVRLQLSGPSRVQHHLSAHRPKTLNLQTYKIHALGDYVSQIRLYGTTDSYSTQTVSPGPSMSCHLGFVELILRLTSPGGAGTQGGKKEVHSNQWQKLYSPTSTDRTPANTHSRYPYQDYWSY